MCRWMPTVSVRHCHHLQGYEHALVLHLLLWRLRHVDSTKSNLNKVILPPADSEALVTLARDPFIFFRDGRRCQSGFGSIPPAGIRIRFGSRRWDSDSVRCTVS